MLLSYLLITSSYFAFLVSKIVRDRESSLKDPFHLKIAILASMFWPVVIPLSLLELKANNKVVDTLHKSEPNSIFSDRVAVKDENLCTAQEQS